jgi:hypothetical protein
MPGQLKPSACCPECKEPILAALRIRETFHGSSELNKKTETAGNT